MLDAAPVAPIDTVPSPFAAHSVGDGGLQMRVGIHTSAFGSVEIRAIVDLSQVSLTIHNDHNLARWFAPEVSELESGLKSQHLILNNVDFSNVRASVQAEAGFQQGQAQRDCPQGSRNAVRPAGDSPTSENETAAEPAGVLSMERRDIGLSVLV